MKQIGTRTLETDRLLLRPFAAHDAAEMYTNWACEPQVTRWMRWETHENVAETRRVLKDWLKNYRDEDYYHWAIVRKADGVLMGSIGIMPSLEEHGPDGYEPGYCIGRAFWGRGYTTEALRACLDYFIPGTGARTLYCCHAVENPASGRVMQKAGFVFTHKGAFTRYDGTHIPALYYELDAKNYVSSK